MEINTVEYKPENPQLVIAEYEYCPENDSEVLKNKKTIKEYSGNITPYIEAIKNFNRTQKYNWESEKPKPKTYLIRKIETV